MSARVRVRFAPSPTGPLHIGGVRTALFNYLFAKRNQGDFILRIEDTDQNRFVPGAEDYILESLKWCGIEPDESPVNKGPFGPYRQSDRKSIYKKYVDELVANSKAYLCFDTPDALENKRKEAEAQGQTFIYNHSSRTQMCNSLTLTDAELNDKLNSGEAYVVRFKIPLGRELVFNDLIRGEIKIDTGLLDDKILFKSDGMPTYHLAHLVDDHLMEISHVIRGEEWLPSLPLHILLYEAFGWEKPEFAHLPLILKPTGKGKLSKRDGDKLGFPVFPLEWKDTQSGEISAGYKERGYLPEAVVNMLALLGWNPGTEKELFTLDELIRAFDLEKVNKAGARFDPEKTLWFQHQYFIQQADEKIAAQIAQHPLVESSGIQADQLIKIVQLLKERVHFSHEIIETGKYFFSTPSEYDEKAAKNWDDHTAKLLQEVANIIQECKVFNAANLEKDLKEWISAQQIGFGKVMQPLRLSLVGSMQGPHLFDIMEIIGKEETTKRIQKAIQHFVTK